MKNKPVDIYYEFPDWTKKPWALSKKTEKELESLAYEMWVAWNKLT